ncbi:nuclear body protein SP140-like protein [Danio aesculapii]|uniref:nuclear body protein SP140-like protein n=1 Tax=Danio aesculapii TaxID=1142201 RepID=UPI0024C0BD7C|nr:nuclear body protein SP140-like protein [Danio aesculapii]
MGVIDQMELDFLTNQQLLSFFHRKKTEISCIEQPHIFLSQLRDYDLLPEPLFEKVKKMHKRDQKQKGVYEVLDWLEKERSQHMHKFWRCVFKDHIVQKYPTLCLLKNQMPDAVISFSEEPPDAETLTKESEGIMKKAKQRKNTRKRNRDGKSSEDSGDPGPSSASTPTRKKPAKKPSFSSPVKKGDNQEIWMFPIYKTQLPVKCGDKEGTLYRDKLPKGEKCILARGLWFSPSEFEKFAGKEKSKNWKVSIRCRDTPLKKLIEENHLQCPPMERRKRKCVQKNKTKLFCISSSESSSPNSETTASSEEESDAEDFQEESRSSGGGSQIRSRVGDEEEDEMADLTVFQAPALPVTCVSLTGTLYKDRFATGRRGKSIRTEVRWFTPEEFVKEEPTLTDGLWKRDILCHGKTLNFLCKKKILQIHSLLCECVKCSPGPKDLMDQNNDDVCYACRCGQDLSCCDECPRAFHSDCHLPAVPEGSGKWICTYCVLKTSQQWRVSSNMTEQEAFDAPVSQYILQCHYLLLCMYKEDIQRVFVEDPRPNVDRYSEFISQPMWLDRIKSKLEDNKYLKFGEFVSDFRLIFSNCEKFNQDNEFGQLGAKLKEIFEEEIQKIFFIQ